MPYKIALVGNPNSGKTTLFNSLTGSKQSVGNWPGVTVERKTGRTKDGRSEVIDLPGIYSLSPYSIEEIVARDCILNDKPDVLINILDGANIERNLYLTVQLLELKRPMVIAINMMDEVEARGERLDCVQMSRLLNLPVVTISARKGRNVEEVLRQAESQAENGSVPADVHYDANTQKALGEILGVLSEGRFAHHPSLPFFAAKVLEGDADIEKRLSLSEPQTELMEAIAKQYAETSTYGDRETMVADARYHFITDDLLRAVRTRTKLAVRSVSDRIDRVVTNRVLALPIFLLIMLAMFLLTFGPIGTTLQDWFEWLFNDLAATAVRRLLDAAAAPAWTYGLLIDAVIGGIGGVLTFLPQITILFFCLSILEDSGYMARAAFIMDRLLRKLGLSGKSFIPMLMGFGCTTPAVMAARTMENEKDRRMTIMLTPFMSCGARLPIYALFAGAFFAEHQGLVVFSMYLLGLLVAILSGVLLKHTLFKGETAPFVLELPPYRLPTARSILIHVWERVKSFLVKAGTVIFSMSVVIWFCRNFSFSLQMTANGQESILGTLGCFLAPLFSPLGFASWQFVVALLAGLVAKESVVSTLTVLFGAGSATELSLALHTALGGNSIAAYAFMAFTLLYVPCISALASIRREMNSAKWTLATAGLQLGAAYLVSLLIYQVGNFVAALV